MSCIGGLHVISKTKIGDSTLLFIMKKHIIINFSISSVIVLIIWSSLVFMSKTTSTLLYFLWTALSIPSFFINYYFKGYEGGTTITYLLSSFIFYSLFIAIIQSIIFRIKKRGKKIKA